MRVTSQRVDHGFRGAMQADAGMVRQEYRVDRRVRRALCILGAEIPEASTSPEASTRGCVQQGIVPTGAEVTMMARGPMMRRVREVIVELQGGVVDSRVNPLSCMESQEEQVRAEATEVTMVEATMVEVRGTTGRCGRPWHVVKG